MHLKLIVFILTGLLYQSAHQANAQAEIDLRNHWFLIDGNQPKPIFSEEEHTIINFFISNKFGEYDLRICHERPIDLWINNQLIFRNLSSKCDTISLKETMLVTDLKDSTMVTIYKEKYTTIETLIIKDKAREATSPKYEILAREDGEKPSFYLFSMILLILFLALLKFLFPVKFQQLTSNPFASKTSSDIDDFYSSFIGIENILVSFIVAAMLGVHIIYLNSRFEIWSYLNQWDGKNFMSWTVTTLFVFLFMLGKYIVARMISKLVDIKNMADVLLQDFIQFLNWLSFLLFVILFTDVFLFNGTTTFFSNLAFVLSIITLISFQPWLYFKLVKFYSRKKLLIISYLCTTEFLPVFLIMYWLLK